MQPTMPIVAALLRRVREQRVALTPCSSRTAPILVGGQYRASVLLQNDREPIEMLDPTAEPPVALDFVLAEEHHETLWSLKDPPMLDGELEVFDPDRTLCTTLDRMLRESKDFPDDGYTPFHPRLHRLSPRTNAMIP